MQCVGVSRAGNYLHETELEKVNFKFHLKNLNSSSHVWPVAPVLDCEDIIQFPDEDANHRRKT